MKVNNIEDVLSENLAEGYQIVRDKGELSPIIEYVELVNQSEDEYDEEKFQVEVHFEDNSIEIFKKGIKLSQI